MDFMQGHIDTMETDDTSDLDDESLVVATYMQVIIEHSTPLYSKIPYHTCPFTGLAWVHDLMAGHPKHICHELGVHLHVFKLLLVILRKMGYSDSQHVLLEEQLAIFLYACCSGLTIRFLGERFQHSNDTISKYAVPFFFHILFDSLLIITGISSICLLHFRPLLSTPNMFAFQKPLLQFHLKLQTIQGSIPTSKMSLGPWMAPTLHAHHLPPISKVPTIERGFSLSELPCCLFIRYVFSLHAQWLGGLSSRCHCLSCCMQNRFPHTKRKDISH
jgi:hypothetical protein